MTNKIRPDILDLLPHSKTNKPQDAQNTPVDPELVEFSPREDPEEPQVGFITKILSWATLVLILTGIWAVGQISIGIPDEVVLNFLMVLLYNWFVKNGYKVPGFFNKIK